MSDNADQKEFDLWFEVEEDSAAVNVNIETGLFCDRSHYTLPLNCGNQVLAELLGKHLHLQSELRMADVRRRAYNQGWRDKASRKTKKKTEFSEDTEDSEPVAW